VNSIFGALLEPIDRRQFREIVERYNGNAYDKTFKSWDHLAASGRDNKAGARANKQSAPGEQLRGRMQPKGIDDLANAIALHPIAPQINRLFTQNRQWWTWGAAQPRTGREDLVGRCAMSISSITSSTVGPFQPTQQSQFSQTFNQLTQAIQSGNLSGAQQAYSSLTQLQSQGQGPSANSPLGQALTQIGQDLQDGSLSSAQQTLQSLPQQSQQAHGHHHHGGGGKAASSSTSSSATSSTSASSTSTSSSTTSTSSATTSSDQLTILLAEGTGTNVNLTA